VFADPPGEHDPPTSRAPLLEPDAAREEAVLRDWYAGRLARRRAARVLGLGAE
jgi:hypothetical protein